MKLACALRPRPRLALRAMISLPGPRASPLHEPIRSFSHGKFFCGLRCYTTETQATEASPETSNDASHEKLVALGDKLRELGEKLEEQAQDVEPTVEAPAEGQTKEAPSANVLAARQLKITLREALKKKDYQAAYEAVRLFSKDHFSREFRTFMTSRFNNLIDQMLADQADHDLIRKIFDDLYELRAQPNEYHYNFKVAYSRAFMADKLEFAALVAPYVLKQGSGVNSVDVSRLLLEIPGVRAIELWKALEKQGYSFSRRNYLTLLQILEKTDPALVKEAFGESEIDKVALKFYHHFQSHPSRVSSASNIGVGFYKRILEYCQKAGNIKGAISVFEDLAALGELTHSIMHLVFGMARDAKDAKLFWRFYLKAKASGYKPSPAVLRDAILIAYHLVRYHPSTKELLVDYEALPDWEKIRGIRVLSSILDYCRAHMKLELGEKVFETFRPYFKEAKYDLPFSYMMALYVTYNKLDEATAVYNEAREAGVKISVYSLRYALHICYRQNKSADEAIKYWDDAKSHGVEPTLYDYFSLLSCLAANNTSVEAMQPYYNELLKLSEKLNEKPTDGQLNYLRRHRYYVTEDGLLTRVAETSTEPPALELPLDEAEAEAKPATTTETSSSQA